MRKLLTAPLIALIYVYKYVISPMLPRGCRHYPSCSTYAIDALQMHGVFRGSLLAGQRIARCHPWGTSGYDPVPKFFFKKIKLKDPQSGRAVHYPHCDRLKQH